MSSSLPNHPSLDHLRHQARDLQRAYKEGEPAARDRVRAGLGASDGAGSELKLSQAQCIIAREHGFPSWRKLRKGILDQDVPEQEDPLHVRYASCLLLAAADLGMLEFELHRRGDELLVEAHSDAEPLAVVIQAGGHDDGLLKTEWTGVLADQVWERLLVMAELTEPEATTGKIGLSLHLRYPHTEWNIAVSRLAPDRLGFELELDHIDTVPPSPKTGERQTPGQRMAAKIREKAAAPLSPAAESALQKVTACYDAATFHRGAIREIADFVLAGTANLEAIVGCAQLAGTFGYHTQALIDIARIASECDHGCPDFMRLAELAVRRLSGTLNTVRLAREASDAQSDAERVPIRREIADLESTAEYATLEEARYSQPVE